MEKYEDMPYVNEAETIGCSPEKAGVAQKLRLMAGYVMANTSRLLYDTRHGDLFAGVVGDFEGSHLKLQSLFNDWKYWNGVIHMAFHELSELLLDDCYRQYVSLNYRFFFDNLPFFKQQFDKRIAGASGHQFFRMDRLDDYGAMAAGLLEVYKYDPDPRYLQYIDRCVNHIRCIQDRLDDGMFCRNRFGFTSLWGDDLYMSVPFLVRAWKHTRDAACLADAVNQVGLFRKYLFNPSTGIYYHYRILQEGHPGVAYWGRANGWMVMAQCQLLEALPVEHESRSLLISYLKEHLLGIARYQAANGMWHQLLDKTDSFHESSCTAMFTYGLAKAINQGWISEIYTSVALAGWNGLVQRCIGANGYLDKVSTGFNFKQDLPFYYNIPIEPGGDHGIGAAIYAGIEIYKLTHQHRDCVWC